MLILLEGPDLSGKTTLAEALVAEIGECDYLYAGGTHMRDSVRNSYIEPLDAYLPGQARSLVLDRWHVSEVVYSRYFNRETMMGPRDFEDVDRELRTRGALLVRCEREAWRLEAALRGSDEPTKPEDAARIMWMFDAAYIRSRLETVAHCMDMWASPTNLAYEAQRARMVAPVVMRAQAAERAAINRPWDIRRR